MKIIFYIFLFIFIFSYNFFPVSDPDFGWHLRYGEEVAVNRNFLTADAFSHTFKGEGAIETEWLPEVIFYYLFTRHSFFAVSLFCALFTSLAFVIPTVFSKADILTKFIIASWAVVGSSTILKVGARPQNISLVIFSVFFFCLFQYAGTGKKKFLFSLPFLSLVWANTHPSFFLGLLIILIYFGLEIFFFLLNLIRLKERKNSLIVRYARSVKLLLLVLGLCLFLSGLRPAHQKGSQLLSLDTVKGLFLPVNLAAETSLSGKTRITISEFLPPVFQELSGILFLLGIIYAVASFTDRRFSMKEVRKLILLLFVIYFSTLTRRNMPFFFLVFIPILIPYTQEVLDKLVNKKLMPYLVFLAVIFMTVVSVKKIISQGKNILLQGNTFSSYCETQNYPCHAVEFIKKEKLAGNMFNHYNWGAYFVWTLRQYPVFIHGRFPPSSLFSEYESVISLGKGWQEILAKYNVGWIIMPRNLKFEMLMKKDDNWKQVYTDDRAVILVKK